MKSVCTVLVISVMLAGCASTYFSGKLDFQRIEAGEIFVDTVELPDHLALTRVVAVVDAPPWRLMNLLTDEDSAKLWMTGIDDVRLLEKGDDYHVSEIIIPSPFWATLDPIVMRGSLDWERMEMTGIAFENNWLRAVRNVTKVEAVGNGDRSLYTYYSYVDAKPWWLRLHMSSLESNLAEVVENIRRMVHLPKFAIQRSHAKGGRSKLLVLGFEGEGIDEQLKATLTATLAQGLTQNPRWRVMTQEEVVALLHHAQKLQVVGCATQECSIDIGQTLAADRLARGTVRQVDGALVVSVTVLKMPEGNPEHRFSFEANGEAVAVERLKHAAVEFAASNPTEAR